MENLVQEAIQNVNFQAIMPSLVLCVFGMGILMVSVFSKRGEHHTRCLAEYRCAGCNGLCYSEWLEQPASRICRKCPV